MEQTLTLPHQETMAYRLKSIVGGCVGNLVEWYDWYVYSAFSLYFAASFFPKSDETAQLLNTAGVFAIGFLMRPIGGWLMGKYADRKGRKAALTLSIILMSGGSLLITIVPGYEHIGVAAPLILVLARMIQGLSIGGEYGTAATYLSEMAAEKHRGFYSSFQYVTSSMGQLIALGVLILLQRVFLTSDQLHSWGWRIPFAIGACLAITASYMRRNIGETESYSQESTEEKKNRGSLTELFKYKKELGIVVGFTIGTTVAFYTFTSYIQKFLVNTSGFSKSDATLITAIALVVFMLAQPVFGILSDKLGRKPMMIAFGFLGVLTTIPIVTLLGKTHDMLFATMLIIAALIILSICTSISAAIKAELFPANIRALGVSLPYAATVALFGGTAEYVALEFKSNGHEVGFYWYITACMFVSLVVSSTMRDTRKYSRIEVNGHLSVPNHISVKGLIE
jgi:MHS family alpha-ketoglutarate permease-like MFS transporter